jgi:cytochrome c biogenesis protein
LHNLIERNHMMPASETRKHPNPVWSFFCSVRLTITLLIILALVSIVGTLIPQRQAAIDFARNLSPGTLKIFFFLDLFNIYHAIWFRLLIGILTLNLIICSINRFPGIWKRFTATPRPDRQKPFEGLPDELTFMVRASRATVAKDVERTFRKKYRRVRSKESKDAFYMYGERGRLTHFGFYLIHLSILIILVGAIVGSIFGFEAYVNIVQGGKADVVNSTNDTSRIPLGFTVRCDRFSVDFYANGTPKEYRSDLTFLEKGKILRKASVLVNHPAHFRGITFYQADYGTTLVSDRVRLKVIEKTSKTKTTVLEVKKGDPTPLPGGGGSFEVADIQGDFMNMGPAVLIRVQPGQGQETGFWVFRDQEEIEKRFPGLTHKFVKLNPSAFKPYTFILEDLDTRYYTGLEVAKDPGVPLVWTGCFLMVGGFFVTFFMSHRHVWIRIAPEKNRTRISVAGNASKNPVGLERELLHLSRSLEQDLNEKQGEVS